MYSALQTNTHPTIIKKNDIFLCTTQHDRIREQEIKQNTAMNKLKEEHIINVNVVLYDLNAFYSTHKATNKKNNNNLAMVLTASK